LYSPRIDNPTRAPFPSAFTRPAIGTAAAATSLAIRVKPWLHGYISHVTTSETELN